MMKFIFDVFDSDYFLLYFIILIVLIIGIGVVAVAFINQSLNVHSGLVAEYIHYELGPDKIRVGLVWYWLPDELIDGNVLGQQVKVWYEFEGTERVITQVEILD